MFIYIYYLIEIEIEKIGRIGRGKRMDGSKEGGRERGGGEGGGEGTPPCPLHLPPPSLHQGKGRG
jgi:hypothetical protein